MLDGSTFELCGSIISHQSMIQYSRFMSKEKITVFIVTAIIALIFLGFGISFYYNGNGPFVIALMGFFALPFIVIAIANLATLHILEGEEITSKGKTIKKRSQSFQLDTSPGHNNWYGALLALVSLSAIIAFVGQEWIAGIAIIVAYAILMTIIYRFRVKKLKKLR